MEPARKFKIIVNSKECGTCSGATPSAVAKKVVKKLCGTSSKTVKFSLKECKRGCERVCGPYQGRMEKLDRPYKRDGKNITHRVVCEKVRKMRGGDLCKNINDILYTDFIINKCNSENDQKSFDLNSVEFIKVAERCKNDAQYIFFNPVKTGAVDVVYEYVAIRIGTSGFFNKMIGERQAIFMKLESDLQPYIIDISEIDLSILLKLYKEITKKIEHSELVAKTIYDKLDEYIIDMTNNLSRNNTISKLASLFKITETTPPNIKPFSFKNKTQLIFFHIIHKEGPNISYYQYVIIRDKNKSISLKEYKDNLVYNIRFDIFLKNNNQENQENHDSFKILEDLLNNIKDLIYRGEVPPDFATTIREKLTEILRNKIVSNSLNNQKLIKYFRIQEESLPIKYITVGSKTSALFGNKYQFIFFNIVSRNNNRYYQYVIIRDDSQNISLKTFNGTTVEDIDFSNFIGNHINFQILHDLFSNITDLISKEKVPSDFATTIRERLKQILKNKLLSNSENNDKLIPYFKDTSSNNKKGEGDIHLYEFGSKTSRLFGNKYQFIFFNIVSRNNNRYYQYVIIRDDSQNISLKTFNGTTVSDITFEEILKTKEGYFVLEKLYRDIILIRNERDRSDFATTIRKELGQYIYGDKLDEGLIPNEFLIHNDHNTNIKVINRINYIFFGKEIKNIIRLHGGIEYNNQNSPTFLHSDSQPYLEYYMFVVFLDKKNNINFYQLFQYKGTSLIIRIDEKIMKNILIGKILEYLYNEINLKYNDEMNNSNKSFYLTMLYSLEKDILKILKKERDLNLLRSRYFYITEKESKDTNDFKILRINKKTYIFFSRCKGKRTFSSENIEYILYKYLIIIDDSDINFYKVNAIKDKYSVFIETIDIIKVDQLFNNVGRLLLGILYGHLLKYSNNEHGDKKIKEGITRLFVLFRTDYLSIDKYYDFIVFVNKVLTGHINKNNENNKNNKNNKHFISVNGKPEQLKFNGTFDFDFLKNKNQNRNKFEEILNQLLKMREIKKNNNYNKKYHFKPLIKSIISSNQEENVV